MQADFPLNNLDEVGTAMASSKLFLRKAMQQRRYDVLTFLKKYLEEVSTCTCSFLKALKESKYERSEEFS